MLFLRTGLAAVSVILVVALGCHSVPLRAPEFTIETATQAQWRKDYEQALALRSTEPAASCTLFQKLAAEDKFPLHALAGLRAAESCDPARTAAIDPNTYPDWLKPTALDVALKLAGESGDKAAELTLATEKSKQNLPQSEKVKWIQLALTRAGELKQDDAIAELNKRLYMVAPRLNPHPQPAQYLAVATDYRLARQFTQAHRYYERVITGRHHKLEERIAALKGLRLSYKNARRTDAHLKTCRRLSLFLHGLMRRKKPVNPALRAASYDADVYEARALWTQNRAGEARAIFERLEKTLKGRMPIGGLYWLKSRMAAERADFVAVSRNLDLALKETSTDPAMHDKILWSSAWSERRQNHLDRAAELFTHLSEQSDDDSTRTRALFWLGKTLSDAKKEEQAKPVFEQVIAADPLGYYGLLAHRHLGLEITFKPVNDPTGEEDATPIPLDTETAEWLYLVGENDALTALLDRASSAYKKQHDQNDQGWFALFKYYAKAGLYVKLYGSLNVLPPERRKSVLQRHPELLFPQPWSTDVRTASLEFGVQPELIYSIMRQESAFDPRARSFADAFGLLQILPEVAEPLSSEFKIPYADMEDLYTPAVNIRIGAAHLRELLDRHKGRFILAVASYNANENAIRSWMKNRYRGDSLEFIEEIPYEETRTYVRLVTRNLIFYSLLNSKSAAIEFPSWVLKLDAS